MAIQLTTGMRVKITIVCSQGGQVSNNVRWMQVGATAGNSITDAAFANELAALVGPAYKANMGTAARFEGVIVQIVHPTQFDAVKSTTGGGAGTVTGDPLPPQTAGLIRFVTGFGGRAYRGRLYMPFPAESESGSTARPTQDYLQNAETVGAAFSTEFTYGAAPNTAVAYAYMIGKPENPRPPIVGYSVAGAWATQRRRSLVGRGDVNPFA